MNNQHEALIARKGSAVTGNYYLAKCDICEEMFTSERMTGGEPIADYGDYGDCYCPYCGVDDSEVSDYGNEALEAWNFQQKYIDALIAALEQSQKLKETFRIQSNMFCADANELKARVEDLESQRKMAFMASNRWADKFKEAEKRIAELEDSQLPVELPGPCLGVVQSGKAVMVPYAGGHWLNKTAIMEALRAAGITVQGGE